MIRSLRRLWLAGAATQVAMMIIVVAQGEWSALAPLSAVFVMFCASRWLISDRGGRLLRREGSTR